tara:strand:- start:1549 stop:2211 length:663 start_codon:yes stop_codon:yes gene_type:complete
MIYPGMYKLKDASVFSTIEAEIQSEIDSLGDLSQYNNALDLPDNFDIDNEFSMETLNSIDASESIPATILRLATFEESDDTSVNPQIKQVHELGWKYLSFFYSVKGLGCPSINQPMNFFPTNGFVGLHNDYDMAGSWILSVSWTESDSGFEYIYHEVDKNEIKQSSTSQGFNYRIYNCPNLEDGKLYQGRKATANSFEWQIALGKEVCQRVCQDWKGLRA